MEMSKSGSVPRILLDEIRSTARHRDDRMVSPFRIILRYRGVSFDDLESIETRKAKKRDRKWRRKNAHKHKEKVARSKGGRGKQKVQTRPRPRRPQIYRPAVYR